MDTKKVKQLAAYMDQLRRIRTENLEQTNNESANQHLAVANMKIGDAVMHLHKAFEELLK